MSRNSMKYVKTVLYTLIVLFFCIVDQRRGSANGRVQFIFVNLMSVGICLLMFLNYKWKDFIKLPYFLWAVIWLIGSYVITHHRMEQIIYWGQWNTALINVGLMGLLAIRLFVRFVIERERPTYSKAALGLFAGFMIFACLSRNDSLWQWQYIALFGMLYLTEISDQDRKLLQNALLNGIILSFFLIQGMAYLYRPYDTLRYCGLYANSNINALYYSMVYAALIGKYCMNLGGDKWVRSRRFLRILCLLFAGAMWSFVCFTMCRTAMLSMAAVTLCAVLYCLCKSRKKLIRRTLGMTVGLFLCIAICAPASYCAVRYMPCILNEPLWFEGEEKPERVHYWDTMDSHKYITWEQVLEGVFGRLKAVDLSKLFSQVDNGEPIYLASLNGDAMVAGLILTQTQTPVLDADSVNSVSIRLGIFQYYFENLNLRGHENAEHGFQLTADYWAPHAHNLILQIAFNFGIPAGIFFLAWILYSMFTLLGRSLGRQKDAGSVAMLILYVNIMVFGMLEMMWRTGQLPFTLLFLLPWLVFAGKNGKQDLVTCEVVEPEVCEGNEPEVCEVEEPEGDVLEAQEVKEAETPEVVTE